VGTQFLSPQPDCCTLLSSCMCGSCGEVLPSVFPSTPAVCNSIGAHHHPLYVLWLSDTCANRRMPSVLGIYRCGTAIHVSGRTLPTRRETTAASMLLGHPCSSVQIAATACLVITRPCTAADSAAAEAVQVVYHGNLPARSCLLPAWYAVSSAWQRETNCCKYLILCACVTFVKPHQAQTVCL
jgi:hypothetical protein